MSAVKLSGHCGAVLFITFFTNPKSVFRLGQPVHWLILIYNPKSTKSLWSLVFQWKETGEPRPPVILLMFTNHKAIHQPCHLAICKFIFRYYLDTQANRLVIFLNQGLGQPPPSWFGSIRASWVRAQWPCYPLAQHESFCKPPVKQWFVQIINYFLSYLLWEFVL